MIAAVKRPYLFEIFALANLAAVTLVAHATLAVVGSPLRHFRLIFFGLCVQAVAGIAIRAIVSIARRDRSYLAAIRRIDWLLDTLRLIIAGALVFLGYGWLKLVVPILHPRLFDPELWELDRALLFGAAPTTFLLDLFSARAFLTFIDWTYANIFFASVSVAYAWVLSHPERRIRLSFANGNAALWISGAWLYLLVPSLGPAFRFPDIWLAHAESLRVTQGLQAVLMRNYQNVLRVWDGVSIGSDAIRLEFGIGAFPSLHVAFQTYVFLWTRRVWRTGRLLFGVFALVIFLGSMITGWHYLIDSLAGAAMAYVAYRTCFPRGADGDHGTADDAGGSARGAHGSSSARAR